MKKMALLVAVAVVALAFNAFAQVEVKQETKESAGKVTEKTEVKDTATGAKATQKTTETATATTTDTKVKGENIKAERTTVDTATGEAGKAKVHIKKGAIKDFSVDWVYYQEGTNYILEYTVKDKADPELLTELGLTADQADMVKAGTHTMVSTSPYAADDIKADFRALVVKDLKSAIAKKNK